MSAGVKLAGTDDGAHIADEDLHPRGHSALGRGRDVLAWPCKQETVAGVDADDREKRPSQAAARSVCRQNDDVADDGDSSAGADPDAA